jgi:hypothetical protein
MSPAVAGAVGLVLGALAAVVLLGRSSAARAEGLFRSWQADEGRRISAEAADATRLDIKAELDSPAGLAFLAADARWLGDPVHLVVFDGDSAVKAGAADELASVTFVGGVDCEELDAVVECVDAGRVRWETLRPP